MQALREIFVQNSDRVIADHVLRAGDGKGGDRNAARERLELHDAESVRAARKNENVRCRQMPGERSVFQRTEKFCVGKVLFELRLLRARADDDFGAGQIERKESFQVFLDGDAANGHENRPRKVELDGAVGTEQIDVDPAGPHAEIAEAALGQLGSSARASRPSSRSRPSGTIATPRKSSFPESASARKCIRESASCSWW